MTNSRFADYATSGAFHLGLSRNQVHTLSMLREPGHAFGNTVAVLERKGLVEIVARPDIAPNNHDARLTFAGLTVVALLGEAGLVNDVDNPVAEQLARLGDELQAARQRIADMADRVRAAFARKGKLQLELEDAQRTIARLEAEVAGIRLREPATFECAPRIIAKDPIPDVADADILEATAAAETALDGFPAHAGENNGQTR